MNKKAVLASVFAVVTLAGCKNTEKAEETHGINLEYMDTSVNPGDDFFRYVNGAWFDKAEIPADRTRWGSFDELRKNTDEDVLKIVDNAIKSGDYSQDETVDQAKALNVYQTYLDYETRNELGISPIQNKLDEINALNSPEEINELIVKYLPEGGLGFFSIYVYADAMDSNKNTIYVSPGSIGLPDRDYYISDDADSKEKRELYAKHIAKMLQYTGLEEAEATEQATKILALETAMAEPRLDRVERRDRRKTYNPMTVGELQALTPAIQWEKTFGDIGLTNIEQVVISMPKYMEALNNMLQNPDMDALKAYMNWTLLNQSSDILSEEIETTNWEFYSKTLSGATEQRPAEERALQVVNGTVGEALGKLYVEEKFPAEAKEKAQEMIDYVMKSFENRIENLTWMEEETKKGALEKLNKFTVKIGYPDNWKDYSDLKIKSKDNDGNYYENMVNVRRWSFAENIADYGKPVDKTRWGMSPQTVNAYFNPTNNEIVFPAAILQPPFYDYKADMAVNFGGIGAVIGHEISHSFDDSGSRYNADGNLVNWWTDKDLEQFTALGTALADQYSVLEPLPDTFVDGAFTLGENIGDLGGVQSAYDGLILYLADNGRPENIDGFTPEQRFFISWGTIWRTKMRDEAIKNQVKTDPHAPGMYRAYVPLQNVDAWYEAFDITPENKLYLKPEERVRIW